MSNFPESKLHVTVGTAFTLQHSGGEGKLNTQVLMMEESAWTRYVVNKIYLYTNLGKERGQGGRERKERKENKSELHAIYVTVRKNGYYKPKCFASLGYCDVLVTN